MDSSLLTRVLSLSFMMAVAAAMGTSEEMNFIVDEITVLTMDHLREELHHFDAVGIMFIAPWCGHCKRAKEDWAAAKERASTYNSHLMKVDGTDRRSKESLIYFSVTAYPTIVIVNQTTLNSKDYFVYKGDRSTDSIVSAVANVAGPSYTTTVTKMRKGVPQVTAYLQEGSDAAKIFVKTSQNLRGIASFSLISIDAHSSSKPNISVSSVEHPEKHVLQNFDGITTTKLAGFIRSNLHSSVSHRVVRTKREMRSLELQPYSRMVFVSGSATVEEELVLSAVAQKWHPENVIIAISEIGHEEHLPKKVAQNHLVIYYDHTSGDSYADEVADLTVGFLDVFIEESRSGLAPKLQKSLEKHLSHTSKGKGVVPLSGATVKDKVMEPGTTTLLLIYTPWCYYSQLATDSYTDVAEAYKNVEDMTVASIDASVNDIPPEFGVFGYPTFIMYTARRKERKHMMPLFYYGNRSSASISEFIQLHNTHMRPDLTGLSPEVPKAGFDLYHVLTDIYIGIFLPIKIPLGEDLPVIRTDLATLIFMSFVGIPGLFYLLMVLSTKYCCPPKRRVQVRRVKPAAKPQAKPAKTAVGDKSKKKSD